MIVALFLLLLAIGLPIVFVIGVTAMVYMAMNGMPLIALPQRMWVGMDNFVLLAIPFYVLMGTIMTQSEVTDKLVKWTKLFVGRLHGGLAHVNVLASVVFAGISGSATADTAAIGGLMIPAMRRDGYDADFATAVTVASSCISPIIPPSIVFVVYAVVAEQSIAAMFLGGIVPGIMIASVQMAVIVYFAKRRGYPRDEQHPTWREALKVTLDGFWILLAPGIILFGILTGAFTPTEAGAIAAVYTGIIAFGYKRLKFRQIPGIIFETAVITAGAYFLVAMASAFAWMLTIAQVPQMATRFITSLTTNPVLILLLINAMLLFVGTFMEAISALIVLVPILIPITTAVGISPIHLGVVMCVNLVLGFITPPVGTCLFVGSGIAGIGIERISKAVLPFFVASVLALLVITLVPDTVLLVPRLVYGR